MATHFSFFALRSSSWRLGLSPRCLRVSVEYKWLPFIPCPLAAQSKNTFRSSPFRGIFDLITMHTANGIKMCHTTSMGVAWKARMR